jgi:hypothetical protein
MTDEPTNGVEQQEVTAQIGRKSEHFREIMPTSFWGGIRPGFIEATAITSQLDSIELMLNGMQKIEHVAEISIKFTPQQAKLFVRWMLAKLIMYEKMYGKIVLEEDLASMEITIKDDELKSKINEILEMGDVSIKE